MDEATLMFIFLVVGYFMGIGSVFIGAYILPKAISGDLLPDALSPKGDVFTVETPDDMALFPDDLKNEDEEHILKKTNKFLKIFGSTREDK